MSSNNILLFGITLQKGGAERVISLLLKELVKDKQRSVYLLLMEDGVAYDVPTDVKLTVLSSSKKSGFRKLIELPCIAYQLSKFIKDNHINVVMSFLYRPNYITLLSKLFGAKSKNIINIRSTTSRYLKEGLLGKINLFLIRSLFNKADLIISNSKGVDEDLKSLMQITTSSRIINNPVDIEYIDVKKETCEDIDFEFKKNIQYIISVGRIIPLKRNKDLIEAFFEIQKENSYLELIFLGEGVLKKELMIYCEKLGISSKVHFLGNVKNPFYYLAQSELFVMTSEIEGFPNVLVEAMACGLPVISSDCKSGPREILKDETYGLLYPVGDVKILVEKIRTVLVDTQEKEEVMRKNLERLEDFKVQKIMKKFEEILS